MLIHHAFACIVRASFMTMHLRQPRTAQTVSSGIHNRFVFGAISSFR